MCPHLQPILIVVSAPIHQNIPNCEPLMLKSHANTPTVVEVPVNTTPCRGSPHTPEDLTLTSSSVVQPQMFTAQSFVYSLPQIFSILAKFEDFSCGPLTCFRNSVARLLNTAATVVGCSGPRAFSKISAARSKRGSAFVYFRCKVFGCQSVSWSLKKQEASGELLRMLSQSTFCRLSPDSINLPGCCSALRRQRTSNLRSLMMRPMTSQPWRGSTLRQLRSLVLRSVAPANTFRVCQIFRSTTSPDPCTIPPDR